MCPLDPAPVGGEGGRCSLHSDSRALQSAGYLGRASSGVPGPYRVDRFSVSDITDIAECCGRSENEVGASPGLKGEMAGGEGSEVMERARVFGPVWRLETLGGLLVGG